MKKFITFLLCLFLATMVYADIDTFEGQAVTTSTDIEGQSNIDTVEGQTIATGVTCADCSGTATFIWECNSTTVGETGYDPCGCVESGGDNTTSPYSDATISSGICVFNDTTSDWWDFFSFEVSSDDLLDTDTYTIFIKFKVTAFENEVRLLNSDDTSANRIYIALYDTNEIRGNNIHDSTPDSVWTTNNCVTTDTWLIVRYRGEVGRATVDHQISVYDSDSVLLSGCDASEWDALGSMSVPVDILAIGNYGGLVADSNVEIDYVHIYSVWVDEDPLI